jgi:ABC-2 type transport system permease protein
MVRFWFSIQKEITLLLRDFSGLMVLFVMPVVLVVVVTLVQENVLKSIGETKTPTLFLDQDGNFVGRQLEADLRTSGPFQIEKKRQGAALQINEAKEAVAKGIFQLLILVPPGVSDALRKKTNHTVEHIFKKTKEKPSEAGPEPNIPSLSLFFDPALQQNLRIGLSAVVEKALLGIEVSEKRRAFSEILPRELKESLRKAAGPWGAEIFKNSLPEFDFKEEDRFFLTIEARNAGGGERGKTPNSIQQNIPAWTLFGMFFIIVPLGGGLLRERQDGMLARLLTMPVSFLNVVSGKIVAYVMICLIQFTLILFVGKFILPWLGTPALDLGPSPAAVLWIVFCAALAAAGFGVLMGTLARTYEQISMFGPVAVVIAAALGGIMVPVYVMPELMQTLSNFSPLAWGHKAFLNVLVRGGGFRDVFLETALLFLLFTITTLLACYFLTRRGRIRIF